MKSKIIHQNNQHFENARFTNATSNNYVWEELRREARNLENEIDSNLVSLSKLGASYSENISCHSHTSLSTRYHTLCSDLEQMLNRLAQVNNNLSDCLNHNKSGVALPASVTAQLHTLQRHRDIFQDYQHEYQKTKKNIDIVKEREELLGSVRSDIAEYKSGSINPRSALLLKEYEHASSSERLLDEQLTAAENLKDNLRYQHASLRDIQNRLNGVIVKFSSINNILYKINFRNRHNMLILAGVTALCLVLLLWYLLH